jgi:hypothetical protein
MRRTFPLEALMMPARCMPSTEVFFAFDSVSATPNCPSAIL